MGAALAYYTLFALAPVLIVVIAAGGLLFGPDAVRGEVVGQIQGLVGREGAETVQGMLEAAARSTSTTAVTITGLLAFFLGATGTFLELQSDLDRIWRVTPRSTGSLFRDLVKQRVFSFGLVLGFAFLLLTALIVSAALAAISGYLGSSFTGAAVLWKVLDSIVSLAVVTFLFGLIYKVMPDVELRWRDVWIGALVTGLLFTIGKVLIGFYLGASRFTSTYGAAGAVIVVLVWVYYATQILLLGAEFTRAYVEQRKARAR